MLRDLILLLSKRREVQRLLMRFGVTRTLVRRFVAGDTLEEALGTVRFLNKRGLVGTLDRLGENVTTAAEAREAAGAHWYPYLMRRLAERPANVLFVLRHLFRA
jgi:proline dehydrogenase